MSHNSHKTEKIASAIYLITSFFADQEPMKWKLRALAADLVAISLSLVSPMFKEREAARLELRSIVLELNSLIAVMKNAGVVSEPNANLMNQELLNYLGILGFPAGLTEEQGVAVLSRNFFQSEEKELPAAPNRTEEPQRDNLEPGKMTYLPEITVSPNSHDSHRQNNESQRPAFRDTPRERTEKPLKEFGAVSVKKNSRQSIIIGLLKRKKEIMIKDVSPLISGCSEKTIQRELSAMVQAGILRKTGEKRWSRYSLA